MKTTSIHLYIILALLAGAGGSLRAQNLVSNGDFEAPTFPGDGDAYPINGAAFSIPGWARYLGTGLFIEHGLHSTDGGQIARYADCRQALCLNDDGQGHGSAEISQGLSPVPGRNYRLSFAQADESMGPATASQVTVQLVRA